MKLSLMAPVIAFGGLAQVTPLEAPRTSWDLFALLFVGLILFVALTSLLALRARPVLTRHAHRRRRPLVPNAWGLDRPISSDAAAGDSAPRPPAP